MNNSYIRAGVVAGMLKRLLFLSLLLLLFQPMQPAQGAEVVVLATHEAKFNLDGSVLGTFRAYTPLRVQDVPPGPHKLYAKSSQSGELLIFKFSVTDDDEKDIHFRAEFQKVRKATLSIPDTGMSADTSIAAPAAVKGTNEAKVTATVATAGAPTTSKGKTDRAASTKKLDGNILHIKSSHPLQVNLDGKVRKSFPAAEPKRFTKLSPGKHKLYLRSLKTYELKVFDIDFPQGQFKEIAISPNYKSTQEKLALSRRRKIGTRAVEVARQLFGAPPPPPPAKKIAQKTTVITRPHKTPTKTQNTPQLPAINTEVVLSLSKLAYGHSKESTLAKETTFAGGGGKQ